MKCTVCRRGEAIKHPTYGVLPCLACQTRRRELKSPDHQVEFTSAAIKSQRVEYARSIMQPFRAGEPSREFADLYPDKAKRYFTPKELKKAKPVWKDTFSDNINLKKTK